MTEKEILIGLKNGSYDDFRLLYDRWVSALYHYVLKLVKSQALAQDIVQETFATIWERHEALSLESSFKSYLFTISYHRVIKELRRQVNNPQMSEFVAYTTQQVQEDAEQRLQYDEFVERLERAKEKLSPRQREIFELRHEYDLKPKEIEERLGISSQTVRNQLAVATKIVREELGAYAIFLSLYINL